jgi:hypothetical protein
MKPAIGIAGKFVPVLFQNCKSSQLAVLKRKPQFVLFLFPCATMRCISTFPPNSCGTGVYRPDDSAGPRAGLPSPCGLRVHIGAAAVELTPDDLRDIDSAVSGITVQGAQYPGAFAEAGRSLSDSVLVGDRFAPKGDFGVLLSLISFGRNAADNGRLQRESSG